MLSSASSSTPRQTSPFFSSTVMIPPSASCRRMMGIPMPALPVTDTGCTRAAHRNKRDKNREGQRTERAVREATCEIFESKGRWVFIFFVFFCCCQFVQTVDRNITVLHPVRLKSKTYQDQGPRFVSTVYWTHHTGGGDTRLWCLVIVIPNIRGSLRAKSSHTNIDLAHF